MPRTDRNPKTPDRLDNGSRGNDRHLKFTTPSRWIARFAPLIGRGGPVLDLACGGGRHASHLLGLGHEVWAVDLRTAPIRDRLGNRPKLNIVEIDLEDGSNPFSPENALGGVAFAGIVVSNYLWRPLFDGLLNALAEEGVLIHETFAIGNEAISKPRDPNHLLQPGELLDRLSGRLQIIAYESGIVSDEAPIGVKQRIVGVKNLETGLREDGLPAPVALPGV